MDANQRFWAKRLIELQVRRSKGEAYQSLFNSIMQQRHSQFTSMRPYGNVGDRKNDGYVPDTGTYYQVYAPSNPSSNLAQAAAKAKRDFAGLHAFWNKIHPVPIKAFRFVFNDEFNGSVVPVQKALAEIASKYSIDARVFLAKDLEKEAFKLTIEQLESAIDMQIPGSKPLVRNKNRDRRHAHRIALAVVNPKNRSMFGLIATAPVRLPMSYFQRFFPNNNWKLGTRTLVDTGLIEIKGSLLYVAVPVSRLSVIGKDEREAMNNQWIASLSALKTHTDGAAFLTIHLLRAKRFEEAADVATEMATGDRLGWWDQLFAKLLRGFTQRHLFGKLTHHMQVRVLNALGLCLSRSGRQESALLQFEKLEKLSNKYRDAWGISQSLVNGGVAHDRMGNRAEAEIKYLRAVSYARRRGDQMILGRALGNLAQLIVHTDIPRAEHLLERSIEAKKAARDLSGLVASSIVRGQLAIAQNDFKCAKRWFRKATAEAARMGLANEQAVSVFNEARLTQAAGELRDALALFKQSRQLAIPSDYTEIILLSLSAESEVLFETSQFERAQQASEQYRSVAKRVGSKVDEIAALHVLAATLIAQGLVRKAKRILNAALALARDTKAESWVIRCLVDSTRTCTNPGVGEPHTAGLKKLALAEAAVGRFLIAAKLWETVAELGTEEPDAGTIVCNACQAAEQCLRKARSTVHQRFDLLRKWHLWLWETGDFSGALVVLDKLEKLTKHQGMASEAIATTDQRGVCYQHLGRYSEAKVLHEIAVSGAERIGHEAQLRNSLNNLGEALRKLGQNTESIRVLKRSIRLAREAKEPDEAISSAHNLALVLHQSRKIVVATQLLNRCRTEGANSKNWFEYVRAGAGLANFAYAQGKYSSACRLYLRAIKEAQAHSFEQLELEICVNLASLLGVQGKPKSGLRILKEHEPKFLSQDEPQIYFGALADLYESVGQFNDAFAALENAKLWANRAQNQAQVADYELKEAFVCAALGRNELSDRYFQAALKRESEPERKVWILFQRLESLLLQNRAADQQRVFDEAIGICNQNGLTDQKIDLHLLVGDHGLKGPYKDKVNSVKAYAAAMTLALVANSERTGEVANHVMMGLAMPGSLVRPQELPKLIRVLSSFIEMGGAESSKVRDFLMWPLRFAQRLAPFRSRPRRLLLETKRLLARDDVFSIPEIN